MHLLYVVDDAIDTFRFLASPPRPTLNLKRAPLLRLDLHVPFHQAI
jgi:hypothetical protein